MNNITVGHQTHWNKANRSLFNKVINQEHHEKAIFGDIQKNKKDAFIDMHDQIILSYSCFMECHQARICRIWTLFICCFINNYIAFASHHE